MFLLSVLFGSITTQAQVFSDQLMFLQSQTQFMTIQGQIYSDMSARNLARDNANRKARNHSSRPSASAGNFTYTRSQRVAEEVKEAIIRNLKKKNPVSGKNLEAALAKDNPYAAYVTLFSKLGLDAERNYADVFTGYMLGMWRIANRKADNPTIDQIKAVRRQVISNVDITHFSNRDKQEKAAYLLYDLIFANEPYEASRRANDRQQLQEDSDAVYHRFLQQNRLDLRKMVITENGLTTGK